MESEPHKERIHMNNIDDLKQIWQKLEVATPNSPLADTSNNSPYKNSTASAKKYTDLEVPRSVKQRLISRLKRMMIVCIFGVLMLPSLCVNFNTPLWFNICWIAFFVLVASANFSLIRALHHADFATLTTVEAIKFVKNFIRRRQQLRIICCILGVALVLTLIVVIGAHDEPTLLYGCGAGAIIGLIIGLKINSHFNSDLKLLKKFLGED